MDQAIIALHLARYRFHWRVDTPLRLPPYAGSTLRGVFGHALRRQACLTRARECRGCAVLADCPYPQLFEPQQLPRRPGDLPALAPYAIETPFVAAGPASGPALRRGENYHFDLVLMTPAAIALLPLIVVAWQQAFAKGVGPGDGSASLASVEHVRADGSVVSLCSAGQLRLQTHDTRLPMPAFDRAEDVHLHLPTPLRIEQRGRLIRAPDLTAGLFLRHLIRRVSFQVGVQQADAFSRDDIHRLNALADQVREGERRLTWVDWQRYSTRQQQKMTLGGVIGHWQLLQVPPQLLPLLYLGQWLHVGKEAAFGLGQYRWQR